MTTNKDNHLKIALCPGTFDPITLGHVDILERGLKVFDRVIIGVTQTSKKENLFPLKTRVELIEATFANRKEVEVEVFDGLLVEFARKKNVYAVLRGLRTVSDFDYENQMAKANRFMDEKLETFFMMTDGRYSHVSSSLIREIITYGGSLAGMVPPAVEKLIKGSIRK